MKDGRDGWGVAEADLGSRLKKANGEIAALEKKLENAFHDNTNLTQAKEGLEQRCSGYEADAATMKTKISELEKLLSSETSTNSNLQRRIKELELAVEAEQ